MNKSRFWMILGCCIIALAAQAQGQSRKPGLWEVTMQMSMSGGPANMPQMPPRTSQVCVSQAMIDKYGGPYSNPQQGQCQISDLSVTATGMTANLTCSGQMNMNGTVQTTFVDANTTKTTIQMSVQMGANTMNMTMVSTGTYKGPDCGSVKPLAMPASK
ncbi:MAG TPA: DUF3617 domain-containing protein [Terracidiphilus sp.]|nr:DUF3617 domain-containing protein [Terracidiphilus sp.]